MKTKIFSLAVVIIASVGINLGQSFAATVPAATILVVRTLDTLSSVDAPGTRFAAQLENNILVNGKVVVQTGTRLSGRVETSKRLTTSSQRLTVNITSLELDGRSVPVKTTGAYPLENNNYKTRRGVSVSRHSYVVPVGRKMEFRLAEPLKL